jgi:hypothetical protein
MNPSPAVQNRLPERIQSSTNNLRLASSVAATARLCSYNSNNAEHYHAFFEVAVVAGLLSGM